MYIVPLCVSIETSLEDPLDFTEVPFSEYQGGEFSDDDIEDTLFEWCVALCIELLYLSSLFSLPCPTL